MSISGDRSNVVRNRHQVSLSVSVTSPETQGFPYTGRDEQRPPWHGGMNACRYLPPREPVVTSDCSVCWVDKLNRLSGWRDARWCRCEAQHMGHCPGLKSPHRSP